MPIWVKFEVCLPYDIIERDRWVVAFCPVLDIYSQGDTREEAKEALIETIQLFLESCFERGVLDEVLKDCGFQPVKIPSEVPEQACPPESYIEVPVPFEINKKLKACRV
jgi:predicted RNase H-like HicB family nuclease